jgi:membrane associated rhomboid family serine protease
MEHGPRRMLEDPSPPEPPVSRAWPPPVCTALLAISVGLFVLDRLLVGPGPEVGPLFEALALYGPSVHEGAYWRVLGCTLVHGGPLHLVLNMWVAYTLGPPLERSIGSGRFLALCVLTALGSSAFVLLFNFEQPTVGASGMILGWAGAMLVTATRTMRQSLLLWLAQVAFLSLLPGISWAGHLGGFLFGLPGGVALRWGPRVYARAMPLLLAIAAVVVWLSAHPK